ncbi:MAG: PDZ domain-containing protein, partial [bacterium]|nr:PDZ domain-containing protein [bacterium]
MKHNSIASALRGGKAGVVVGLTAIAFLAGAIAIASAHPHKFSRTIELKKGAFLGVQMQELTDELRNGLDINTKKGVLINEVIEESPADKAGLHDGDVIVTFNGKDVETPSQLSDLVAETKSGDEVKIKVVRDGRPRTFEVTI